MGIPFLTGFFPTGTPRRRVLHPREPCRTVPASLWHDESHKMYQKIELRLNSKSERWRARPGPHLSLALRSCAANHAESQAPYHGSTKKGVHLYAEITRPNLALAIILKVQRSWRTLQPLSERELNPRRLCRELMWTEQVPYGAACHFLHAPISLLITPELAQRLAVVNHIGSSFRRRSVMVPWSVNY